jgi:hypothetical protein
MDKQKKLFEEEDEHWTKEWQDMPEFIQEDLTSFRKIVVHFKNNDDVDKFSKLIGQKITPKQPSLWWYSEDEGVRRGRETAKYLKSLGYMRGKKDKRVV